MTELAFGGRQAGFSDSTVQNIECLTICAEVYKPRLLSLQRRGGNANMNTITISKINKNDDLVILPRKEYEQLFRFWASAESMLAPVKRLSEKG